MKKWLSLILICCFAGILFREYRVSHGHFPLLLVEEKVVLFHLERGEIVGMGRVDSARAKSIARKQLPFFVSKEIVDIWTIPIGQEINGNTSSVQRVSQNLVRTVSAERAMWWMGEGFSSEEKEVVVKTGIDLNSDWWIMMRNTLPDFFPIPRQGIVFAGDRVPSQKTITFSQEKKIPLITAKETMGFSLFLVAGEWELKTRKNKN